MSEPHEPQNIYWYSIELHIANGNLNQCDYFWMVNKLLKVILVCIVFKLTSCWKPGRNEIPIDNLSHQSNCSCLLPIWIICDKRTLSSTAIQHVSIWKNTAVSVTRIGVYSGLIFVIKKKHMTFPLPRIQNDLCVSCGKDMSIVHYTTIWLSDWIVFKWVLNSYTPNQILACVEIKLAYGARQSYSADICPKAFETMLLFNSLN